MPHGRRGTQQRGSSLEIYLLKHALSLQIEAETMSDDGYTSAQDVFRKMDSGLLDGILAREVQKLSPTQIKKIPRYFCSALRKHENGQSAGMCALFEGATDAHNEVRSAEFRFDDGS
jgi:hypothetical protein